MNIVSSIVRMQVVSGNTWLPEFASDVARDFPMPEEPPMIR